MVAKLSFLALTLTCAATLPLAGCGSDTPAPPKGAMHPPDPHPPLADPNHKWTLAEKIAAVQNSGMNPDQKKAMIAQLQAAGK